MLQSEIIKKPSRAGVVLVIIGMTCLDVLVSLAMCKVLKPHSTSEKWLTYIDSTLLCFIVNAAVILWISKWLTRLFHNLVIATDTGYEILQGTHVVNDELERIQEQRLQEHLPACRSSSTVDRGMRPLPRRTPRRPQQRQRQA